MNKNMKKSKYAALMLASTLALSTIVTTAPEVFGGQAITAQAAPIENEFIYTVANFDESAKGTLEVEGALYEIKLVETTATITDLTNPKNVITAKVGDIIQLNGLNLSVKELTASAKTSVFQVQVIQQQTPAAVTAMINDLDLLSEDYETEIPAARISYNLLPKADQAKVKNETLLKAHEKLSKLPAVTDSLPLEDTIKEYKKYTESLGKIDTVEDEVKGKKVVRVINKNLEANVTTLEAFIKVAKAYTDKDEKKVVANKLKEATTLLKLAQTQQKVIAASGQVEKFNEAYALFTKKGSLQLADTPIEVKKGKFKIGDDTYTVSGTTGAYTLTHPSGEKEEVTTSFAIVDLDVDGDDPTANNDYRIEGTEGSYKVIKEGKTLVLDTKIPVLKFDSKMSVNAYKTLRAGKTKYNDAQIETITLASDLYKNLSSDGKKQISKTQVATLKKYETALKVQQTLEKKLLSEDTKGVIKAITSLKYGSNYEKDITDARTAYNKLTAKFKKKIPAATLAKLKDHEAAVVVTKQIDNLPVANLLKATTADTAETATGLVKLEEAMKAITAGKTGTTGSYDKLSKTQKPLVKNITQIAALEKQIATQKNYLLKANNDAIVAWQTALEKLTRTTDVQVINNQFLIGSDVYTLEYDKKEKTSKVYKGKEAVTLTGDLKDPAKDVAKATFKVGDVTYQVSAAKGKFKVDILSATEANLVLPILDLAKVTDITKVTLYTEAEAKLIEDATTAYATVTKLKDAKPFVKAEDVAVYNKYVAALKAQKALEAKDQAAAIAFLKGKKEVTVANGKATDTAAILTAIKALDADSKYKYIKDLKATALTAGDKKVTIKVSDKLSFDLIVKEETLAPTADETAKAIIDGKSVTADNADKAAVLTAIKALGANDATLQALTESNITILGATATVTFTSGVTATVTITPAA